MDIEDAIQDEQEELFERLTIFTDKGQEPYRIDKFLMNRIEGATRNKIQQAIEAGMVLINDKPVKSNYKIRGLDKIVVYQSRIPETTEIIPENIPINIIYEDNDLLVINKPSGMVVHPGSGNRNGTLINAVAWHLKLQDPTIDESSLPRFGLVHRIDKNTTGLLVMAKGQKAMNDLAKQFFDHTVYRRYFALVWGDFAEEEGTIHSHVGRHQRFRKLFTTYPEGEHGKDAITHYKVLERFNYVTLLECRLETGRTHQIRVHMKYIGHPVACDELYGNGKPILLSSFKKKYKLSQHDEVERPLLGRLALHSSQLKFSLPNELKFDLEAPLPKDMQAVLMQLRKNRPQQNL